MSPTVLPFGLWRRLNATHVARLAQETTLLFVHARVREINEEDRKATKRKPQSGGRFHKSVGLRCVLWSLCVGEREPTQ